MAIFHKYKTIYTKTTVIKELMEEIGRHEYYRQLRLKNLEENKPILMKNFFLESKMDGIHLCYRYPLLTCSIMVVDDRYNSLPKEGWEIMRNEEF
ncbi:hypothetical protein [Flagellimonas flava]|uniref:hypothetical protein n=1 Tax=Flagellimonas flava TaxID=570519 RepID=UPI003D64BE3A